MQLVHIVRALLQVFSRLILIILLIGLWGSVAYAEEGASFGLQPIDKPDRPDPKSYFVLDTTPGQMIRDEVRIVNTGTAAGTVRLYAVDATTGQTSGAIYLAADDPRQSVGSWISLDQQEVTLGAGEERVVGFTITVPEGIGPGQHLGGIVAQDAAIKKSGEGEVLQINMQTRIVTAVQVNIPGPTVEKLEITDLAASVDGTYQILQMGMRNDGNELLKANGILQVFDIEGQPVHEQPLQIDTMVPGTEIQYPLVVDGQALPAGAYRATVELTYGEQRRASYETSFEVSDTQIEQLYEAQEQRLPDRPAAASSGLMDQVMRWPVLVSFAIGVFLLGIAATRLMSAGRRKKV